MQGINEAHVEKWLVENIDGVQGPFTYNLIAGGRSNITFLVVDANGRQLVLRRPPMGHVLATAHDMAREHRIITAVGKTNVPVPETLGLCIDTQVNDAPFYVMEYVSGLVLDSPEKGLELPENLRLKASENLIDVLADLHAVDIDQIGLGDLAKREGYVERQVKRWSTQWAKSKTRELPAIEEVALQLAENIPVQQAVAIAHGDYRFGNCLTNLKDGSITGVLDWELCTLGDPLADLGYVGIYWTDPGQALTRSNDPSGLAGFCSFDHLVDRYATRTGYDVSNISYYKAFASFRLAVIAEGVYARYLHGAMGDQKLDLEPLKISVDNLAESALQLLKKK